MASALLVWKAGVPNRAGNLGSDDPPPVRDLLEHRIREARCRSILVPPPALPAKPTLGAAVFRLAMRGWMNLGKVCDAAGLPPPRWT